MAKKAKLNCDAIIESVGLFSDYVNSFHDKENEVDSLKARLEEMQDLNSEFTENYKKLKELDVESLEPDFLGKFKALYFDAVGKARRIIRSFVVIVPPQSPVPSINSVAQPLIKLPTLNLPVFAGAYEDWLSFRDSFKTLIHENECITEAQKLHYLRSSLKGEALQVIQSIETSSANYAVAWDLLKTRFENKRVIVYNHMKALFNLPKLIKECHSKLRKMSDDIQKHVRALGALGQPIEHWGTFIILLVTMKLDPITLRDWELKQHADELPTSTELFNFLKHRCQMLESVQSETKQINSHTQRAFLATNGANCIFCKDMHNIYFCKKFLNLAVSNRISNIKKLNACFNCLKLGHFTTECNSQASCRRCNKRHNTILHNENIQKGFNAATIDSQPGVSGSQPSVTCNVVVNNTVLLATAEVEIVDALGTPQRCRALLDSASQSNFITEELCKRLQLRTAPVNIQVTGISQSNCKITKRVNLQINSINNQFNSKLACLVIPKITDHIPSKGFNSHTLEIPDDIKLADPNFNESAEIDMLIGAGLYFDLFMQGQIKLGRNQPTLQKTRLGWIVSGPLKLPFLENSQLCHLSSLSGLENQMAKFWELEDGNKQHMLSREDEQCESNFTDSTCRSANGQFMVTFPFKSDPLLALGDSRQSAESRFLSLEKRLNKNKTLKHEYKQFMAEYIHLGHMSKLEQPSHALAYFLPHHPVINNSKLTTKLRVVFDGSAKTTSGKSLNDILLVGPTIQDDLLSIILRFRCHLYVISADITKMYRQILIKPEQRNLQQILWRENSSEPLHAYQLNTVTYGTAPAAFLAIRCLRELGLLHENSHPNSSRVICNDFYVDDLLTGSDCIDELIKIQHEVDTILKTGGFVLCKWVSNSSEIIKCTKSEFPTQSVLEFDREQSYKTLGLQWDPNNDMLSYLVKEGHPREITKRNILSAISKIFDPLGLIGPTTIIAKILMQSLWQAKISWDESVPLDIHTKWSTLQNCLLSINKLKIPRHVLCKNAISIELHGFCDASEQAYGACIYLRAVDNYSNINIKLLCAKARVAPLKTVTIPRLELCGALVLAQLSHRVRGDLKIKIVKNYYWSDSTIVLSWLRGSPHQWKTFVANRVSDIQNITNINDWSKVDTKENPADIISRGEYPDALTNNQLWWSGPTWLRQPNDYWPVQSHNDLSELPEAKVITLNIVNKPVEYISKYSSFSKVQNITAWCLRFVNNARVKKENRQIGNLSILEMKRASDCLIQIAQNDSFAEEISQLKRGRPIKRSSNLLALSPFLDDLGILRVGGRLKLSNLSYHKKHPALIPSRHHISKLIAQYEHVRLLHAGPEAVLASLRQKYWPISGRNLIRGITRNCIKCFRAKPGVIFPFMGELPAERVTPARPFLQCGVDYAGPFQIKDRKTKPAKIIKAWMCLFVCFTTKAVHIEIVSDLSSEAFIAVLRRFSARRGTPKTIYSDNGTNFVGAKNELSELYSFIKAESQKISALAMNHQIEWKFIPARSPHMGGLWESGIKSAKTHLKRVLGNALLTYEELSTVTCQIESCLNSRPLTPLSNDPNDLDPLTPAHFLIGELSTNLPDPNLFHIKEQRLSIFQKLQRLKQDFWKRWSKEYVSGLQLRRKWNQHATQKLAPGDMVLLHDSNLPPVKWKLGRVTELHPGSDGTVRVVSIRTHGGTVKRAVTKISPLPMDM